MTFFWIIIQERHTSVCSTCCLCTHSGSAQVDGRHFAVHINNSPDLCSAAAEAAALYLKSDDLCLELLSLVGPVTRRGFATGTESFCPQWEGELEQTSGCQDNWQRHLDHRAGMTEWHSLPLIVFPPSLCQSTLSPSLSLFLSCTFSFSFCFLFALPLSPRGSPSDVSPSLLSLAPER